MRIDRLMTVVIQVQDMDAAVTALNKAELFVTQLASSGGFLGSRNSTLLIGISSGKRSTPCAS